MFHPGRMAKPSSRFLLRRGNRGLRLFGALSCRPKLRWESLRPRLLSSLSGLGTRAYTDLPGHHLRSTLDLIATPHVSSYPEDPTSGEDEWAGADFSGQGDPETFMHFLEASNYCLSYSDSDDGDYDPSRECFNLEVEGAAHDAQGGAGPSERRNATPPPSTTPGGHPGTRGAALAPAEVRRPDLE